jgi:hypothetical protein
MTSFVITFLTRITNPTGERAWLQLVEPIMTPYPQSALSGEKAISSEKTENSPGSSNHEDQHFIEM